MQFFSLREVNLTSQRRIIYLASEKWTKAPFPMANLIGRSKTCLPYRKRSKREGGSLWETGKGKVRQLSDFTPTLR